MKLQSNLATPFRGGLQLHGWLAVIVLITMIGSGQTISFWCHLLTRTFSQHIYPKNQHRKAPSCTGCQTCGAKHSKTGHGLLNLAVFSLCASFKLPWVFLRKVVVLYQRDRYNNMGDCWKRWYPKLLMLMENPWKPIKMDDLGVL